MINIRLIDVRSPHLKPCPGYGMKLRLMGMFLCLNLQNVMYSLIIITHRASLIQYGRVLNIDFKNI